MKNTIIKQVIFGALAVLFVSQFSGCTGLQSASVTIDNDLDTPITITIDGAELGTVSANRSKKFNVEFGERKFLVKSEGQVIYKGVKAIEPARACLMVNQYLFNPSGKAKYCSCRVEYIPFGETKDETKIFDEQRRSLASGHWIPVPENTYVLVKPDNIKLGPDTSDVFQIYREKPKRATASKRTNDWQNKLRVKEEPAPVPKAQSNPFVKQVSAKKESDVPVEQGPFSTKGNPFFRNSK
jgi:hypothetical protein